MKTYVNPDLSKHKVHEGEIPSDVTELRGLLDSNVNKDVKGFLIQSHPNSPSMIITQLSTGRTVEAGLYCARDVINAIDYLFNGGRTQ